jgi:TPR repeat protein
MLRLRRWTEGRLVAPKLDEGGKGDADSQYRLGIHYEKGQGVTHDDAEAVKWYRKAAEQG